MWIVVIRVYTNCTLMLLNISTALSPSLSLSRSRQQQTHPLEMRHQFVIFILFCVLSCFLCLACLPEIWNSKLLSVTQQYNAHIHAPPTDPLDSMNDKKIGKKKWKLTVKKKSRNNELFQWNATDKSTNVRIKTAKTQQETHQNKTEKNFSSESPALEFHRFFNFISIFRHSIQFKLNSTILIFFRENSFFPGYTVTCVKLITFIYDFAHVICLWLRMNLCVRRYGRIEFRRITNSNLCFGLCVCVCFGGCWMLIAVIGTIHNRLEVGRAQISTRAHLLLEFHTRHWNGLRSFLVCVDTIT